MDASTTYILQRILADVEFLKQQNHIQEHQATAIKAQLNPLLDSSTDHLASRFQTALPSPSRASATSSLSAVPSSSFQRSNSRTDPIASAARNKVPPPPPSSKFATPPPSVEQHEPRDTVKALWTFEAAGGADELPFKVGDVIHVLDRSDADWWKGSVNGREGVFPSNYTETCEDPLPPPPSYPSDPEKASLAAGSATSRWQPPKARFTSGTPTSSHATPAGLAPVSSSPSSSSSQYPPAGGPGGLAPAPTTEEEKKRQEKLKKLGGRMGTAVATGAGFGVGAGLVSSMF